MIEQEHKGDVFEAIDGLVDEDQNVVFFHGCNARGVMGSGVADQVRKKWPRAFGKYKTKCLQNDPTDLVGTVVLAKVGKVEVANAITQKDFGREDKRYARSEWIAECLDQIDEWFAESVEDFEFLSVRVGCGLGGLEWEEVRETFEEADLPWKIYYL